VIATAVAIAVPGQSADAPLETEVSIEVNPSSNVHTQLVDLNQLKTSRPVL